MVCISYLFSLFTYAQRFSEIWPWRCNKLFGKVKKTINIRKSELSWGLMVCISKSFILCFPIMFLRCGPGDAKKLWGKVNKLKDTRKSELCQGLMVCISFFVCLLFPIVFLRFGPGDAKNYWET